MPYNNILVDKENLVATVTINRPPVNALNSETIAELTAAFKDLGADGGVRVVIVTGAGQYTFIAGADIKEFLDLGEAKGRQTIKAGQDLYNLIETLPKPVIAAINGACLGGGNELAMACDFRIAAESARFGQPEINLGIIPGWGGTSRLLRLIGRTRALELLMTGDMLKAADALRFGLLNRVVPDNELMAHAKNLARKLAMQAPLGLAALKRIANAAAALPPAEVEKCEMDAFIALFSSEDGQEGIGAFLGKRKPQFKGK